MKAWFFTRCGAFFINIPRSFKASITSFMLPCCRYRTPPCTNFVLREEVPFAKSNFSTNRVLNPLVAASTAIPKPVAPPPMMQMSHMEVACNCCIISPRCKYSYLKEGKASYNYFSIKIANDFYYFGRFNQN